jgi:hypothetical protein
MFMICHVDFYDKKMTRLLFYTFMFIWYYTSFFETTVLKVLPRR